MPFDPISATVAGAGVVLDFLKSMQAQKTAKENQAFQMAELNRALSEARTGQASALREAGALREDQFGNATYYDPNQGRWVTTYSPTQQRLIDEGQARQRRAQIRGAQASQDYDKLRGEYLYNRPPSEAQDRADILRLLLQAQGQGERAINTITSRFGVRTAGNVPQVTQMDRGPSASQQLAETMLKARGAATDEYGKRLQQHQLLLPALKQFEDTANYVAPVDPTGSAIVGMAQKGIEDRLRTRSDYDKLLATISASGDRSVGASFDSAVRAAQGDKTGGDLMNLAKMLMPGADKTGGTLGGTRGARASTSGGDGGVRLDNRFNYGKWDTSLGSEGYGGEAAQRGLLNEGFRSFGSGGGFNDPNQLTSFSPVFGDTFTYSRPPVYEYGNPGLGFGGGDAASFAPGDYYNPWQF